MPGSSVGRGIGRLLSRGSAIPDQPTIGLWHEVVEAVHQSGPPAPRV